MLLERLDIDVYGPFGKKTVGPFSNGINAIWGPEGSGKTAVVDFIRGVMLGGENGRFGKTVGRVTWADHRGMYHCGRESDGTLDGRLTTEFSPRDAAYADERYRHYGYHSRRPEAIPPALLDMVVAPDSRETSIAAIFEAAAAVGFEQAFGSAPATDEVARIRQRIIDVDAQLNRDFRGSESREVLETRRRRLTTELETLERDACATRREVVVVDHQEILKALAVAREKADRYRCVQEDCRQSIAGVQAEIDRLDETPQPESQRCTIAEAYRTQFQDLDAQLVRWQRMLQELRSLRERLEMSVADSGRDTPSFVHRDPARLQASTSGGHHYRSLVRRLEHAIRHLDTLIACYTDGYYRRGSNAETRTEYLHSLQHDLQLVAERISRSGLHRSALELDDDVAQLRRCEQGLMSMIEKLIGERSDLMHSAATEHNVPYEQLSAAYGDWHPHVDSPHLRDWLVSQNCPPRVGASDAVDARRRHLQDELSALRTDLQQADDRLATAVREIDELQREGASLPQYRHPVVDSERMAHLRNELADVRRRLEWVDSRDALHRERQRLADELSRCESAGQRSDSPLTACANHWLSRLTAGRLRSLELTHRDEVRIDGRRETDVSTDDRRTAALALRLAICCLLNENRTGIPIVVDDPVIHHQDYRIVARTLAEFSAGGNQVIVLTQSQSLVDYLSDQGAWTDALPARTNLACGTSSDMYDVNRYLDMAWRESHGLTDNPERAANTGWNPSYDYPRRRNKRGYYEPKHRTTAGTSCEGNGRFFLTPESHVDLAPSIDAVAAARLRGIGCESVGDLLTSEAENIASRIGLAGVNGDTVRRWQIEADLVCRVPGLRAFDARVLVGCGVTRPEQLTQLHPADLLEKVERFLSTDLGRETLRSGTSYELSRITTWIASASRAALKIGGARRTSGGARRRSRVVRRSAHQAKSDVFGVGVATQSAEAGQSRYGSHDLDAEIEHKPGSIVRQEFDYDGDGIADETIEYEYDDYGNRIARRSLRRGREDRAARGSRTATRTVRRARTSGVVSSPKNSETYVTRSSRSDGDRSASRASRPTQDQRTPANADRTDTRVISLQSSPETLRFYLGYDSPVVDAPSIGTRKAEALQELDIFTVGDLVNADAESLAEQLNHRRVTTDTVIAWQHQSVLMCTIPNLRGHDAQLLVAADITDAAQLAASKPAELLDEILPIAHSKDGERMLRGSAIPDLDEVSDWVRWARQRHEVRAA